MHPYHYLVKTDCEQTDEFRHIFKFIKKSKNCFTTFLGSENTQVGTLQLCH